MTSGVPAGARDEARADEPIAHALISAAAERGIELQDLDARAGLVPGSAQEFIDGLAEPSDVVLERLARSLGVEPSFFFEYRLRVVLAALVHDVERLNVFFVRSLSPLEQAAIGSDRTFDEQLASAVNRLLVEQGLTQAELADSLGLSQGYVSRLLRERFPSAEFLEGLALALNVEPHYFREYRLQVVRETFIGDPSQVNALFDELGDPLELAPYVSWTPHTVAPPEKMAPDELLRVLLEIIDAEGPVMGRRVYSALLAEARCELTKNRKSRLNRALAALVRRGYVAADNETREAGQVHVVLSSRGGPTVAPRRRGPRRVVEVPLRELAKVARAAATTRLLTTVDEIQEAVCSLYEAQHPTSSEREHMNRAITRVLQTE
jgi:transcriptional regulator with XRE-family HTH domain